MSRFIDYLDQIKGITRSDYRTAQIAGISRQMLSMVRNGQRNLSPENVLAICRIAQINPAHFMAAMHSHMAKSENSRKAWRNSKAG